MEGDDADEQPPERDPVLGDHRIHGQVHRAVRPAQRESWCNHGEQAGAHHHAQLQAESHDAISLHFRLGDYDLLRHLYPSMTTAYYTRALAHIVAVTGRED